MKIAVVGGGLTGAISALLLADRGHGVVILDRAKRLLSRASTANEGKIHLGYVYGADRSFRTAARLMDDALQFRSILERICTGEEFEACLFEPFRYVVPESSSLSDDVILEHFQRVDARVRERSRELGLGYLGRDELADSVVRGRCCVTGSLQVDTQEAGVWPQGIAKLVRHAVEDHPRIDVVTEFNVSCVSPVGSRWCVCGTDGTRDAPFDAVINAAWADRRNIDTRSGFADQESWYTRLKFGVLLHDAQSVFAGTLPVNSTGTLGPYGDSVYYPQDDTLYCSWYPAGRRFGTNGDFDIDLPDVASEVNDIATQTWAGYAALDPEYRVLMDRAECLEHSLIGDYIMARGQSDIEDPVSGLHLRSSHGPVQLAPGYWSVETGKYTSAPRVADEVVRGILGGAS